VPPVLIEVRREYTEAQEIELIDRVFGALQEAYLVPATDRNVRLVVHAPHRFSCPPDKAHPELYTHITIDNALAGRSRADKQALRDGIVADLGQMGIPADHIVVLPREVPSETWAHRGHH